MSSWLNLAETTRSLPLGSVVSGGPDVEQESLSFHTISTARGSVMAIGNRKLAIGNKRWKHCLETFATESEAY
jgi:hypothetical protein